MKPMGCFARHKILEREKVRILGGSTLVQNSAHRPELIFDLRDQC